MERQIRHALTTPEARSVDQDGISQALCSEIQPRLDARFGEGIVHRFGPDLSSDLEVFPQSRLVRFRSPEAAIALGNLDGPTHLDLGGVGEGHVAWSREDEQFRETFMASADGGVIFVRTPKSRMHAIEAAQRAQDAGRLNGGGNELRPSAPKYPSSVEPTDEKAPSGQEHDFNQKEKQPRVQLNGRVGAEPVFYTVNDIPRVQFPLDSEDGQHLVYTTKQRALMVRDFEFKPGEDVRVTGVVHTFPDSEKIYAWSIKRNKKEDDETGR